MLVYKFIYKLLLDLNIITLVSGVGHILIASITGIHKKMNLPEFSESHRKAAKDFDCAIRIGVNGGSLEKKILEKVLQTLLAT